MGKKEYISLPNNLTFGSLDCIYDVNVVSEEFEQKARKIFVITKNMELDLKNPEFFKTITHNYEEGKFYTYVLPDDTKSKKYEEDYKNLYSDYLNKFNFIFVPKNTFDLLQEIVIYDPPDKIGEDSEIHGFMLVTTANETTLYVKLSYKLVRKYLKTINSYKDIEKIPAIKRLISGYQENAEIIKNRELNQKLSEYFQNPLSLIKNFEEFLTFIENSRLKKKLTEDIKEDLIAILD